MEAITGDFEHIVMPGLTGGNIRVSCLFPANAAPPSMLAEMLVTTIAAQCMLWQTSPAATEVESVMVDWLRQARGCQRPIPVSFRTTRLLPLSAVLTMRERATGFTGKERDGLAGKGNLRIYCSDQVHSSIDRACWVAGIGQENLVKLPTKGARYGMDVEALEAAIARDRATGHMPA